MKRLATLAALSLALMVASLARADWRTAGGLDGGPLDFWIADAGGYFSVHTNGPTAYRMVDNGTTAVPVGSVTVPNAQGKCTAIVADKVRAGTFTALYDEAAPGSPITLNSPTNIQGCRVSESIAAITYGDAPAAPASTSIYRCDAGEFGTTQLNIVFPGDTAPALPNTISTHTLFGRDYAYVTRPTTTFGSMFLVDGVPITPFFNQTMTSAQRSEIWASRSGSVRAVQVGTDGGQLITLAAPAAPAFEDFGLPSALIPNPYRIRAVSLSEVEGGPNGAGFGMLVVESATVGVPNVWRAVPDPANVGRYWVPSTVQPPSPSAGIYDSVRCRDGKYCVLGSSLSGASTGTQLALYRNLAAPVVAPPAFIVQESASGTVSMTVDAGDPDGDAIFVTWAPDSSAASYFNAPLAPDPTVHDGRTYQGTVIRPNPLLCGVVQASIPVTVSANDGLNQGAPSSGTITVVHTPPGQPGADQVTGVQAGLPAVTQTYTFASNGCGSLGTELLPSSPATAAITSPTTLDVRFQPPRVWCDETPDSGVRQFQVKVVDGLVKSPAPATATFVILPWGEPEPPFGAGRTVAQDAGTAVAYRPDATHLCEGDAGSFPGVDTSWTWTASGAGFTPVVLQADAGLLPQSGAVTPSATVVALDCQSGTVTFQATNTTRMPGGIAGPASSLTVNVTSTLQPLGGTLAITAVADGGSVSGVVDLNPIQCPQNRTLTGTVELVRRSDGGLLSSGALSGIPASYTLRALGACGGGQAAVRATVSDSTGTVGPQAQDVDLLVLNPGFASVNVGAFKIACGDVARADASVTFGPTDCDSAQVDWSSTGAVAIAPGATGSPVELTTVGSDFNALIGLPVDVTATSTAETGVKSVPAAPAVVTVDPFVSVVHRVDSAVASESRVLGVEVQLTNPTACDLTGVELHESLDGVRFITGSATGPDGGIPEASPDTGELVVPGLSLPANQTVTVRYAVRPTLFGEPRLDGIVVLRSVPLSERSGLSGGGSTCGCESASGGATALIGLAAAAALRRRRRVRARS